MSDGKEGKRDKRNAAAPSQSIKLSMRHSLTIDRSWLCALSIVVEVEKEEEERELTQEEEEKEYEKFEREAHEQSSLLNCVELRFALSLPDSSTPPAKKSELRAELLSKIVAHKMGPFYLQTVQQLQWTEDTKLSAELKEANEKGAQLLLQTSATQHVVSLANRAEREGSKD